jgi:hypothetical protein
MRTSRAVERYSRVENGSLVFSLDIDRVWGGVREEGWEEAFSSERERGGDTRNWR